MSEKATEVLKAFLVPLLVSVVVGLGSAYVHGAVMAAQVDNHESRIESLEGRESDLRDRMVRLETKIDILLERE